MNRVLSIGSDPRFIPNQDSGFKFALGSMYLLNDLLGRGLQWCGLRPSVLGQDRSETKKSVLVLVLHTVVLILVLQVWCCAVKQFCHARRHNDLEGHSNFSSTIYSFSILCLEHHYCGDQQWLSLT